MDAIETTVRGPGQIQGRLKPGFLTRIIVN
jgi:hypothetical protein